METPSRTQIFRRILSTVSYRLWLYRKRHYMITLIQIIMPPLILFMFATIHSSVFAGKIPIKKVTISQEIHEEELYGRICNSTKSIIALKISQQPSDEFITILTDSLRASCSSLKFVQVKSEDDMVKLAILYKLLPDQGNYVGGIVINWNDTCKVPHSKIVQNCLQFKIRMAQFIPSEVSSSDFINLDDTNVESYYPLMGLQLAISRSFMTFLSSNDTKLKLSISVQGFPYPKHIKYVSHLPKTSNRPFLSTSFVLGMTFIVYSVVRAPCSDKESGFKVYLHLMGLPSWAYWLIWILNDVLIQMFAVCLVVLLLFLDFNEDLGTVVKHGNPVIWALFLMIYAMASVSFCTFLASFFRRGILATYTCATIWLLSYYFAELFLPSYIVSFHEASKIAMCLFPNAGLLWGITLMTTNAGGISWENMSHRLEAHGINMTEVLAMLTVDVFLYFILTLYTDMLRPGEGPNKPWYFIFKSNCLRFTRERRFSNLNSENLPIDETGNKLEAAIKFDGLTRYYRKNSKAIDGITMRIKEDKCTAFVGHNGSGKSTLLYLLCGGLAPTRGKCYVKGYSITSQMSTIQSFTSICTQNTPLSEDMTVLEHLILVGKLKGLKHSEAITDARTYLQKLDLLEKCNRFPDYLLEFEKRKLLVIMAMIGKSQVVLIDEPTRGLEDDMKRSVWDFILDFRNKTILVATSSIGEAYALGSRVAILAHGKVVALGSPQHLENLFVTGYHLKLKIPRGADTSKIHSFVKAQVETSNLIEPEFRRMTRVMSKVDKDFDVPSVGPVAVGLDRTIPVTETPGSTHSNIKADIPREAPEDTSVEMEGYVENPGDQEIEASNPESEILRIQLPKTETILFCDLFTLLENPNVLKRLGILDWNVELYSIDTAFKDANMYREWADVSPLEYHGSSNSIQTVPILERPDSERVGGIVMSLNRFKGLLIKRIMWMYGTRLYVLVQFVLPLILLIITIQGTNSFFHSSLEKSEIEHSLNNFAKPIVLFRETGNSEFAKYYKSTGDINQFEKISGTFEQRISRIPSDAEARLSGTYVAGAEIHNTSVIAKFSPIAFHAGPISLSLVLNAYVKYMGLNYTILSSSHPIESDPKELLKFYIPSDPELETDEVLTFAIMLGFGFFIFTSGFVLQPLAERTCGLRKLQLNTTLSKFLYWFSFLIIDMILLMTQSALVILTLRNLPDHRAFRDIEFSKHFVGIYILAGYGAIIQSYVASFVFRQAKTCIYAMLSYNQVLGIFSFILGQCISGVPGNILQVVLKFFLLPYSVPSGFFSLITMARENTQCNLLSQAVKTVICTNFTFGTGNDILKFDTRSLNKSCCDPHCLKSGHCKNMGMYYNMEEMSTLGQGLVADVLFLGIHSILITILLILVELGVIPRFFQPSDTEKQASDASLTSKKSNICETIKYEQKRMKETKELPADEKDSHFLIDSISVSFHSRLVLTRIVLVVKPGEIMAIVGPSGSGKTVLMKVLANFITAKTGNAYYMGKPLYKRHTNMTEFIQRIGYCPAQITQMYSKVSGLQLMRLFGRLRGIPESKLEFHVSKWLTLLGLEKRASGHFQFYTESMKRKLLVALALIGDPPVLLLDDPSENLDPLSKLQFWSVMKSITKNSDRIVIFTTSRTEDLEKNVDRMAILVNGNIERIMSPDEMMTKFGQGFTITIHLKPNPVNAEFDDYVELKEKIEEDLHGIILQEEQYTLKYNIEKGDLKWSELFKLTEEVKAEFENIVGDYTIRQTQLEDVYQALASKQQRYVRTNSTLDEFCIQFC